MATEHDATERFLRMLPFPTIRELTRALAEHKRYLRSEGLLPPCRILLTLTKPWQLPTTWIA